MIRGFVVVLVACSNPGEPPRNRGAEPVDLRPVPSPWARDEAEAFKRARAEHKGVLVQFRAAWSVPDEEIDALLKKLAPKFAANFVALAIDVTEPTDQAEEAKLRYNVKTSPAVVLVDTDGTEVGRVSSNLEEAELRAVIDGAAKKLKGS